MSTLLFTEVQQTILYSLPPCRACFATFQSHEFGEPPSYLQHGCFTQFTCPTTCGQQRDVCNDKWDIRTNRSHRESDMTWHLIERSVRSQTSSKADSV